VTSVAFEWLDVGVYSRSHVSPISSPNLIAGPILACHQSESQKHLRVRMCLSRCSSLVNDCPQYVQKTMIDRVALNEWRTKLQEGIGPGETVGNGRVGRLQYVRCVEGNQYWAWTLEGTGRITSCEWSW
jgi:hypothetical protein